MVDQWTSRKRVAIIFSDNCQTVGPNSIKFNKHLGTLAHHFNINWCNLCLEIHSDAKMMLGIIYLS